VIDVLRQADDKGLHSDDYDAGRWDARFQRLNDPVIAARVDTALTVCVGTSPLGILGLRVARKKVKAETLLRPKSRRIKKKSGAPGGIRTPDLLVRSR
jgi:hypothetical protein